MRNIHVRGKHRLVACLMCFDQGPSPQPRHVPQMGIEPVTFRFVGQYRTHSRLGVFVSFETTVEIQSWLSGRFSSITI